MNCSPEIFSLKTIGLTGAAGCGKSTVLKIFQELGWKTVDADAVCASLHSDPGSGIHPLLRERWGGRVIAADGTTDKRAVAAIVFADEAERKWLEQVIHPFIERELEKRLAQFPPEDRVMLEVPLLFECGWEKLTDRTVAVWSPPGIQMERLLKRGWSREHAEYRIRSQFSADRKLELADYGIINDSGMDTLRMQCEELNRCLNS
jgi:dephospho-coA kinase